MKNVEARNRAGFEPILLVAQLALEELNRLLLHANERAVQQNLIELRPHTGDDSVDRVAKPVVGAIALKIGGANLRYDPAAGEDHLRRANID